MPQDTLAVLVDSASSAGTADTLATVVARLPLPGRLPDSAAAAEALRAVRAVFPDSVLDVKRAAAAADSVSGGLWTRLVGAVEGVTGAGYVITEDLLLTVIVFAVLWVLRTAVLAGIRRRASDPRTLYRWRKGTLYAAVGAGILILLPMWLGAFSSVATFFGLLSAGLAIALRDPIVNLFGWFYILWRRPFNPGDRITVRDHTGDVTDQRLFSFTLLEVATETGAFQSTGRIVLVPNGWVFLDSFVNHTGAFAYIWNEIAVRVTFESNWRAAKDLLLDIVGRHAETFSSDAETALRRSAAEHFIFFSKLTPTVYTSVDEDGVCLTMRYLVPPRRKRGSEQSIWEDTLDAFADQPDVAFAYRTQRMYRAPEEAKPGLGGPEPRI